MEAGLEDVQNDKGVEKLMDEYLKSKGFYRKKIAKDGSCLFRAVAEQVLRCQSRHTEVRATCVDYLKKNRSKYESFIEGNFEEYLQRLEDPQNWVGEVEISALAVIYRHDFIIFQEPGKPPVNITENSFSDKVRLCFLNGNHYDSVYPTEFVNNAALCQSILYELLYERVYGVDHNVVARYIKSSGGVGHDGYGECKSSEESDLEEEDDFWANDADVPSNMNNSGSSNRNHSSKNAKSHQSRSSLSQRVRQSLNPSYFRNVEYDIWLRSKRAQQKRDFCIAAGMQYSVGDKCKVRLDNRGKFYSAYIQAVRPNNGPVTVFIEELGEKHSIPLWNLRPSSVEGESWSTVAERGKRLGLVNGNGHHSERDGRGGRRQGKGPANAHAPMAGPSGRVQKQHSWPPQATADEQASGRNGYAARKSESGTPAQEPHFGLSPDERQAREEEQRSQALLEIMHRDERSFPALGSQGGPRAAPQAGDGGKKMNAQTGERRPYRRKGDPQVHELSQDSDNAPRSSQRGDSKLSAPAQPGSSPAPNSAELHPLPEPTVPAVPTPAPSPAISNPPHTVSTPATTTSPAVSAPLNTVSSPAFTKAAPAVSVPPAPSPAVSAPLTTVFSPAFTKASPAVSAPPAPSPAVSAPLTTVSSPAFTKASPAVSAPPKPSAAVSAPVAVVSAPPTAVSAPLPSVTVPPAAVSAPLPSVTVPPAAVSASLPSVSAPQTAVSFPNHTPSIPTCPPSAPPPKEPAPAPPAFASAPAPPTPTQSVFAPPVSAMAAPASTLPPHVQSLPPPSLSSASTAPVISSPAPVHNAPPLMVPNPPHQRDPAPPTGFPSASHSLEPPSFNGANPCLPGVIPQLGIAPGPSTPPVLPEHLSHPHAPSPSLPHHGSMPFQQIPNIFQDPLYPGFPLNDKEERVPPPPFSCMRNGQDLPREMNVLRFFFNLGVKAFTNPGWAPQLYLYPLQQAYAMHPKMPFVTSWYHDTPPPGPVLCVNSMPASAMAVQDSYGHSGGYGHAIAGGRASGQFDQPHCQVQPGPGMGMLGMSLAPPHPDLSQGSDSRSNLRYSPQPPASLPPHMGGIPWHGPRPGTYPGAYPTHPPPPHLPPPHHPPPTQYLSPSPQFPPVSLGYPVPRLASGAPMVATVPQVSSADGPAGKVIIQTLAEGPAGMPSPAPERERGKEKRVTTPPMNSQPPADVPTEQAPSMEELTETSSCAESKVGSGYAHSTANPSDTPGLPLTLPPDKVNICLKEEVRSIVVSQEAANEGRSNDREATVAAGGNSPEVPVQSAVPSSDPQPYNMAYTPSEVWEEEGEPSEATLQSGRSYYSRSFRGRRGHDDGRGYRDNRWRGEGRGYRGRRGPDDRRDYNYRDRRVEYYPSYPSTNKGQNSRGRGRGYNQYANGRETSYTVVNQRNHNYAES